MSGRSATEARGIALATERGAMPGRAVVVLLQLGVFVAVVGTWQALAMAELIDPFFYSRPSAIAAKIWEWLSTGYIWPHLAVTLVEALLAFVIGGALGIVAG